ncbi:putative NADH dehydrogenase subunit A [delta proteobacterium NaphS2]|nr:putative NADH dehydrogenase subunit A [delta proteobacterium NaphS2]
MTAQTAVSLFSPWEPGIFSLALYTALVLALVSVMLFLCTWLGEKKPNSEKTTPYECGILPTGNARFRYPVPFYRVALFFLIFDLEAVFIFAWAVAFKELGWAGWVQITFFILVLLLSLFYVWKKGGLHWKIGR